MKIRTFDPGRPIASPQFNGENWEAFHIKSLSAYAIEHATLFIDGVTHNIKQDEMIIETDNLHMKAEFGGSFRENANFVLQIYYYGIRDYKLLFPDILQADPDRATRLGLLYEEAEKCFENGAWLSFSLMSGAIFEHMLYFKLKKAEQTLKSLTNKAEKKGIITAHESQIIHKVRSFRNAIHCNLLEEPYIQRYEAMDTKSLIDRLILSL